MIGDPTKAYLGDGLYAEFDGYHVWLRAERLGDDGIVRMHEVALDTHVLDAFAAYTSRLAAHIDAENKASNETPPA